jgi:hypothetical protein
MELTPALVLATWIAGIAGGATAVAWWRIVGPGYVWMSAVVVAGFGAIVAAAGGGVAAVVGTVAAAATLLVARRREAVMILFAVATVAFLLAAWEESPLVPVLTGVLFLGGVTSEMLLGHWYLVDPKLPRWALQRLCVAAGIGLAAEVALVVGAVISGGVDSGAVFAWAYAALSVMTGLLLAAVWFSLREPRYTGVMAATGLSYLAVLTSMGVLVVGRMVAFG